MKFSGNPSDVQRDPEWELLRELVDWEPAGGVVSVYFEIDPADRSEGWRIGLKDALRDLPEAAGARVLERFGANVPLPSGRTQIGFIEAEGEREIWSSAQMSLDKITAVHGPRPALTPLVCLLDDGWPIGVVVAAVERLRVLEWALGRISELDGWELEVASLDWRERKAPQRNAQGGTGVSSAGKDQYDQRLEHNRHRFLKQAGELVVQRYGDRPWREIVVIGEGDLPQLFARGLGAKAELMHQVHHDLIRAPTARIAERVEEELEHLNRLREERIVSRIEEAIGADKAALGPDEVLRALQEGRVNQAIFDAGREFEAIDGRPYTEQLIAQAAATGADVIPAEGLSAAALRAHDGAAALLRY